MTTEMANIAAAVQRQNMTTAQLTQYIDNKHRDKKRHVRKCISLLIREGYPIVNLQDGKGYRWTDDLTLLKKFYAQERSRAIDRLLTLKNIRKTIRQKEQEQ